MRKSAWRKKYELPPGYVQPELFEEQAKERPGFFKALSGFLSVVMVIFLLTAYLTQQIHLMNMNQEVSVLEKQLETIHRDNESLRLEYTQAENLAYVEQIAVKKLGMVRPDQVIYLKNIELASR